MLAMPPSFPVKHSVPYMGRAILPAAAFRAALSGHTRRLRVLRRRLKAGCSQDWMPHKFCRLAELRAVDRLKPVLDRPEGLSHSRNGLFVAEDLAWVQACGAAGGEEGGGGDEGEGVGRMDAEEDGFDRAGSGERSGETDHEAKRDQE